MATIADQALAIHAAQSWLELKDEYLEQEFQKVKSPVQLHGPCRPAVCAS